MPLILKKKNIDAILGSFPLVFAFLLPLSQKLSAVSIAIWMLLAVVTTNKTKLYKQRAYLIPILYYFLIAVSLVFSETHSPHFLEHKLGFLLLPLLFFLRVGKLTYDKKRVLHFFVYGCLLAIGVCVVSAFYRSFNIVDGNIVFRPKIQEGYTMYHSIIYGGNHFFGTYFSILHQTVYFSMYLTMSLLILFEFPFKKRIHTLFCDVLILLAIAMVMNRASYLALLVISLFFLFSNVRTKAKRGIIFLAIIFGSVLLYKSDPRIKRMEHNIKTFLNADDLSGQAVLLNNIDRRLLLWYSSVQVVGENILFGVGIADVKSVLNDKVAQYQTKSLSDLNAHNLFLQVMMELGLAGLVLVIWMLINIFRIGSLAYSKSFVTCFVLLLIVNFIFESMFNRYSGLSFVIFFYCLLVTKPNL